MKFEGQSMWTWKIWQLWNLALSPSFPLASAASVGSSWQLKQSC